MSRYYISARGDGRWKPTKAKTLRGAKIACSKSYQQSVDSALIIGLSIGAGDLERVERVAIKYGHNNWQDTK